MAANSNRATFILVGENLAKLGAISLSDFISPEFDEKFSSAPPSSPSHLNADNERLQNETSAPDLESASAGDLVALEESVSRIGIEASVSFSWVTYSQKGEDDLGWGAALQLIQGSNDPCVYSTDTTSRDPESAKVACIQLAISQGVLNQFPSFDQDSILRIADDPGHALPSLADGFVSLQDFDASLPGPRPFPIPKDFSSHGFSAKSFVHSLVSSAKGTRLVAKFFPWISSNSLHGCLLRLDRPAEVKSYIAEPSFTSRTVAEWAVCLRAVSQGMVDYIRELTEIAQLKLPPEHKQFAWDRISPYLGQIRAKDQTLVNLIPVSDRGAHGYKVEVCLSDARREWAVEPEYCAPSDAKAAALYMAAQEGLFDFIEFDGKPLPPGRKTWWESAWEEYSLKRKRSFEQLEEVEEGQIEQHVKKKPKKKKKAAETGDGQPQAALDIPPKGKVSSRQKTANIERHLHPLPPRPIGPHMPAQLPSYYAEQDANNPYHAPVFGIPQTSVGLYANNFGPPAMIPYPYQPHLQDSYGTAGLPYGPPDPVALHPSGSRGTRASLLHPRQ